MHHCKHSACFNHGWRKVMTDDLDLLDKTSEATRVDRRHNVCLGTDPGVLRALQILEKQVDSVTVPVYPGNSASILAAKDGPVKDRRLAAGARAPFPVGGPVLGWSTASVTQRQTWQRLCLLVWDQRDVVAAWSSMCPQEGVCI